MSKDERAPKLKQIEADTREKMREVFGDKASTDSDFEARFQKILQGIPTSLNTGNRREAAESIARCLRRNFVSKDPVSEEELRKAYVWMDWSGRWCEVERPEIHLRIFSVTLFVLALVYAGISIIFNSRFFTGWVFWPATILALALDVVCENRRAKRSAKFLSENPPPEFK